MLEDISTLYQLMNKGYVTNAQKQGNTQNKHFKK